MNARHEWKHEITWADAAGLRARLSAVMETDPHTVGGRYCIHSLYFDTADNKALREKLNGVNRREKFRLRYYNRDSSFILLENKQKADGLCVKRQLRLTPEEAQALIRGEPPDSEDRPLLGELCRKMAEQRLRPKTVVEYTREPFVYAPGNVRVTLDYGIRAGLVCGDFLDPDCPTIPVPGDPIVLEVKWDSFLPSLIRDLVQTPGTVTCAFSKYATCRIYG